MSFFSGKLQWNVGSEAGDLKESDVLDGFPEDCRLVHLGVVAGHNIL